MITNTKMKRIDKEAIDFAEETLKKKFQNSKFPVAENCMYLNRTGKKHCNATTQTTCRHCRFYSPTMEAKKKYLEKFEK